MEPSVIGAKLRKIAQVIGRKPPASEKRKEHERLFRELEKHNSEMSLLYEQSTHIAVVRTYRNEMLYNAHPVNQEHLGTHWVCGHCEKGELGFHPHVGDNCPMCAARVEEIIRRHNYKKA